MNRFMTLIAATAAFFALPALAHDGVHIDDPYARSMGGVGTSGAVFFVIENHQTSDDRLIGVASDVAQKVELHTHKEDANGVMQMLHMAEGLVIAAEADHALVRGGDHVMLMGLTRALADGDVFTLTLTFERAGEVTIEVPVDNARKADGGMDHSGHAGHGAAEPAKE
jgi:periplasmic copper chaperone A